MHTCGNDNCDVQLLVLSGWLLLSYSLFYYSKYVIFFTHDWHFVVKHAVLYCSLGVC